MNENSISILVAVAALFLIAPTLRIIDEEISSKNVTFTFDGCQALAQTPLNSKIEQFDGDLCQINGVTMYSNGWNQYAIESDSGKTVFPKDYVTTWSVVFRHKKPSK